MPLPAVFVDTSAIYALLDRSDANHARWPLAMDAVRRLLDDLLPVLRLHFVGQELHGAATAALLASGSPDVSLVDRVSFELMRRSGITEAFAFDRHFQEQGFTLL
jgi:uncharacterized protein